MIFEKRGAAKITIIWIMYTPESIINSYSLYYTYIDDF